MKILVIGTGGVGSAFAAIAQRRSFFDRITLADVDPSRPQAVVDRLGDHDRFNAARVDASSEDSIISLIRDVKADAVLNATDPRFNPQIFDACLQARRHVSRHGRNAVTAASRAPVLRDACQARRLPVRAARELAPGRPARARRDRRRTGRSRRLRATCGGRAVFGDRRDRRARRREPDRRGIRLRADVLDLDDDRGVPQPAGDLGKGARVVHHRTVLGTGDLRLPRGDRAGRVRQRRTRRGPARPACDRMQSGHVQVRARRRVHRRPEDAAEVGPRLDEEGEGRRSRGRPRGTWWRLRCPIR